MKTPHWRYAREYRQQERQAIETRHSWIVRGRYMCLELWVTEPSPEMEARGVTVMAGLESHYLHQTPWHKSRPNHEHCSITGGNCWHDGTSLYAMEKYLPMWEPTILPYTIWDEMEIDLKKYEKDIPENEECMDTEQN